MLTKMTSLDNSAAGVQAKFLMHPPPSSCVHLGDEGAGGVDTQSSEMTDRSPTHHRDVLRPVLQLSVQLRPLFPSIPSLPKPPRRVANKDSKFLV